MNASNEMYYENMFFCPMIPCPRHDGGFFRDGSVKKNFTTEEALWIGKQLDIKFEKFDVEQFRVGLNVELEHGTVNLFTNITNNDPILTGKITLAHLNEYPDYYHRLAKMEDEAEEYWKNLR